MVADTLQDTPRLRTKRSRSFSVSGKTVFDTFGSNLAPKYAGLNPTAEIISSSTGLIGSDTPRRAWAEADGMFWGTPQSHDRLPVGLYRMTIAPNIGPVFMKQKNDTDDLVSLPDS